MEAWGKTEKSKLIGRFMGPYLVVSTSDLETASEVLKHGAIEDRRFLYAGKIRSWMKPYGIFFC